MIIDHRKCHDQNTVAACLDRAGQEFASYPLVICGERTVSFEQMNSYANRVANAFLEMGIIKGDRVIILLENCLEWLYTWFGIAKMGAVAVPINTSHRGSVLEHMIDTANAKVMVAGKGYFESRTGSDSGQYLNLARKLMRIKKPPAGAPWRARALGKLKKYADTFYH